MIDRRSLLGAGAGIAAVAASGVALAGPATGRPRSHGRTTAKWAQLRAALQGDLVLPGDAEYDKARQLASAQWDHIHPQAVAYCESAEDVRACVLFAQDHAIHTSIRSGGHCFTGWSSTEGLVINLTRLNSIRPGARTAHIGPAAQMVDIVDRMSPHGLSVPGGFCPSVCPGGFVTGGGHGWQHRKFGPASDFIVSARVVLADGRIVTASEYSHKDLLWALRGGGGGNFGVVTDFEMSSTDVRTAVIYTLTWPWDRADRMMTAYQEWAQHSSPDLAADCVLQLPDAAPGTVPNALVTGAYLGSQAELEKSLAELTSLVGSKPTTSLVKELPYNKAMMHVFGCDTASVEECHLTGANPEAMLPRETWTRNRGRMFARALPASGVTDLLASFDARRREGQLRYISLMALGGNANKPAVDATAYVHRDAQFTTVIGAGLKNPAPAAEDVAAAQDYLDAGFAAVDPHSNGRAYVNYPDPKLADYASAYYGTNLPRLSGIKRDYDPYGFFVFPQSIKG